MARIVYTAIVDSIRGSIGGTTFQSNKHGYTVKQKPNMKNPKTSLQATRQAALSKVARAWRDLTSVQRTAYVTFASSFPQYAKHNPTSQLTGYEVFVRYNCLQLLRTNVILAAISQSVPATDTLTYSLTNDSGDIDLAISSTTDDGDWYILFFISRVFGSANNYIGTAPRYIRAGINDTYSFEVQDDYLALFGVTPAIGDVVAMDALLMSGDSPYVLARDSQLYTIAAP